MRTHGGSQFLSHGLNLDKISLVGWAMLLLRNTATRASSTSMCIFRSHELVDGEEITERHFVWRRRSNSWSTRVGTETLVAWDKPGATACLPRNIATPTSAEYIRGGRVATQVQLILRMETMSWEGNHQCKARCIHVCHPSCMSSRMPK